MRVAALMMALALGACSGSPVLSEPPWSDDEQAVIFVRDGTGTFVGSPRIASSDDHVAFDYDEIAGHQLLVMVYPPPSETVPDLLACGVALASAEDTAIGEPLRVMESEAIVPGQAPRFIPGTGGPALSLVRCTLDPCPPMNIDMINLGTPDMTLRGMAVLDDGDIVAVIGNDANDTAIMRLNREGEVWRESRQGSLRSAAWDGDQRIYSAFNDTLTSFDLAGREVAVTDPPMELTELVYDGVGGVAARGRLNNGRLISIDGAWPEKPGAFTRLALVPGSGLAYDPNGVWRLDDGIWKLELTDARLNRMGGDALTQIAFNEQGEYRVFRNGSWGAPARPLSALFHVTATGFGDGRLALAGSSGRLSFESEIGWCDLSMRTMHRLEFTETSRDGTLLVAGGTDSGKTTPPIIIRIELK